jgi:hypothetical protein
MTWTGVFHVHTLQKAPQPQSPSFASSCPLLLPLSPPLNMTCVTFLLFIALESSQNYSKDQISNFQLSIAYLNAITNLPWQDGTFPLGSQTHFLQ